MQSSTSLLFALFLRMYRLNSKRWISTYLSKIQVVTRSVYSSLSTKALNTCQHHLARRQNKNLRAATITLECMSLQKTSATCSHSPQLTKCTRKLKASRRNLHPQLPIQARLWLTMTKRCCWLRLLELQKQNANLIQCLQTELMIRLEMITKTRVSEIKEFTKWLMKYQRVQLR